MNLDCPICGTICSSLGFDPKAEIRVWECNPSKNKGIVKRLTHYSFITKTDTIIQKTLEFNDYMIVIKTHPIQQTTVLKHSSEKSLPYYQEVYKVEGAMDLTNFDKEKLLKKLKTYTVFA